MLGPQQEIRDRPENFCKAKKSLGYMGGNNVIDRFKKVFYDNLMITIPEGKSTQFTQCIAKLIHDHRDIFHFGDTYRQPVPGITVC